MTTPDANDVARILRELGDRLELEGGNPYRARAYARAADSVVLAPAPLDQLIEQGRLRELPGIGEALEAVITEIYRTGQSERLETLRQQTPAGVLEMLRIPGLKPDRIRKLHGELGLASVADLEAAARSGRLASLKGYGPAFERKVLQGIELSRLPPGLHLHRAAAALRYAATELARQHPGWTHIAPAGDFRRGCELVRDLALAAIDPGHRGPAEIRQQGELRLSISSPEGYGAALLFATGSAAHLDALGVIAAGQGLSLGPDGLSRKGVVIAAQTEEEIYAALGLPFIPPELRETGEEVQWAQSGELAELVSQADLRGVLHVHTTESDGADTLGDMAAATRQRGYAYLGVTDHSQTAHYAGGLKPERVGVQQDQIDRLNARSPAGFHVFKGIESDILPDGSLDFDDEVLGTFDFVIASVQSRFGLDRKEQTERIIRAIENPHTTILGHVTGRQLQRRPGYELDMERILRACAKNGVAIEINAHPWRLDLDWRWCRRAVDLGCLLSINPDAHSTDEIDNIQWGVLMARKGGVPKDSVLNAFDLSQFRAHLEARKARRERVWKANLREPTRPAHGNGPPCARRGHWPTDEKRTPPLPRTSACDRS